MSAHDTGNKTFSAAFNNHTIIGGTDEASIQQELEDFVTMVFNQLATAKSYARRLYRFFVGRDITDAIEEDIITPLAQTLYDNNYDIQPTLTELLCSQHFCDEADLTIGDNVIGDLVKSPLELIMQLYTLFEVDLPDYGIQTLGANAFLSTSIYDDAKSCGFQLLRPVDVNGYPSYTEEPLYDKLWITASNLKPRYDLVIDKLLAGYTVDGFLIKLDSAVFVKDSGHFSDPSNATILLQDFFDLLFVSTPTGDRYTYFEQALLGGLSAINWQFEWNNYLSTNDAGPITLALDNLIKAMVKSPEFQVM